LRGWAKTHLIGQTIFSYDETFDKNQFCVSQNALKLTYIHSNVEFPRFSGVTPRTPLQGQRKGVGMDRGGREGKREKGAKGWEKREKGEDSEREWGSLTQ